jgi:hypothetical protein
MTAMFRQAGVAANRNVTNGRHADVSVLPGGTDQGRYL